MLIRRVAIICALLVGIVVPVPGRASLLTQDTCPGVNATVSVFKQVGNPGDMLENLGFDGLGTLWVSNQTANQLQRYDAEGTLLATIPLSSPGAVEVGPDGWMYANFGDSAQGAVLGKLGLAADAGVVNFDPSKVVSGVNPAPTPIVTGLKMANGAIFDKAGSLYTSNDLDTELTRIVRDRQSGQWKVDGAWTAKADVWGANGLVAVGNQFYAAVTFDMRSAIERIPLKHPEQHSTFAQLTLGVASLKPAVYLNPNLQAPLVGVKGLDDMTLGPDGRLYVVANPMGELLRVDLKTGQTCLLASGLLLPSSVRFARSFGGFDSAHDLFISEWSGAIRVVHLS